MRTVALVLAALCCCGCSTLRPDSLSAALAHQSHFMAGYGPAPFGDSGSTETEVNAIEGSAEWERGPWFSDGTIGYALSSFNDKGGPWLGRVRVGMRVRL